MTTERRLRRTAFMLNALLNWYAFCLIAISIANLSRLFVINYVDLYSTVLSVGVFGVSLFTSGEKYNERADEFRSCYLELQSLYHSSSNYSEKMSEYHKILQRYQNQSDDDFDTMVVNNWLRGKVLNDASGSIPVTTSLKAKVAMQYVARYLMCIALFVGPLIAGYYWIKPLATTSNDARNAEREPNTLFSNAK